MRRILAIAFVSGVILAGIAGYLLWRDYERVLAAPLSVGARPYRLVVDRGVPFRQIADRLAGDGVIANALYLRFAARARGLQRRIQAGEYDVQPGMSSHELFDMLVNGRVVQHAFTIVEGWRFADLRRALADAPALEHTPGDWSDDEIMAALGRPGVPAEGRFMPDTYHYILGARDLDLLERAARALDATLAHLWDERDPGLPLNSPDEVLVLASIVEKETAVAAERAQIAGVFVRRLQRGMRLQTDPTVIYGLGERFDGNLRRVDLAQYTPYNTYQREGLPPTPIALPGAAAIEAVVHPAGGEALYFVARGDGSHHFSATLTDHNRAVSRFQLGAGAGR